MGRFLCRFSVVWGLGLWGTGAIGQETADPGPADKNRCNVIRRTLVDWAIL